MKKKLFINISKVILYLILFSVLNTSILVALNVFLDKDSVKFPEEITLLDIIENNSYASTEKFILNNWQKESDIQNRSIYITSLPNEVLDCQFVKCNRLESTIVEFLETKSTSRLRFTNINSSNLSNYIGALNIVFVKIFNQEYILVTFWKNHISKTNFNLNIVVYKSTEKIYKIIESYSPEEKEEYIPTFLPNVLYSYSTKYYPYFDLGIAIVLIIEIIFIIKRFRRTNCSNI